MNSFNNFTFSFRPKDHKRVTVFTPKSKELVFDIDMTDYDEVKHTEEILNCCYGNTTV